MAEDRTVHVAAIAVELADGPGWPLADELADSGIPFMFMAGIAAPAIPFRHAAVPALCYPFSAHQITMVLAEIRAAKARDAIATAHEQASGDACKARPYRADLIRGH